MYEILNYFHGTRACVRGPLLSPRTVQRVRRVLCGCPGCTCGGDLGERRGNNGEPAIRDSRGDACVYDHKPGGYIELY